MVDIPNVSELTLTDSEYCYLTENQAYNNSTFKVRIPRIMSSVSGKGRETFNKNIFANSKATKPTPSSSISVQSFITIPRSSQCNLLEVASLASNTVIPKGTQLRCKCLNGDYKQMKIVDF